MMPRQKTAQILIVGNEILNGTTLDTNSFWLSGELSKLGLSVERKITVRDDLRVISLAFKYCISQKPDWVFSVGGLGPTYDDMTIQGLALALKKKLKLDPAALEMLKESYKRRARLFKGVVRRLTKSRLKMATLPQGSAPLQNLVGSAPGVLTKCGGTSIVSFPGVPSEMKSIFMKEVIPLLKESSQFFSKEEWIKIVGVSESQLAPAVSRLFRRYGRILYVKSHPKGFEKGKLLTKVQIILTSTLDEKEVGLKALHDAACDMEFSARKLGARTTRLASV